ncbi:MAG: sugar ABC transporter permease [Abditibacteriota bacterium]|nr:sugar ABC transporter permease [Abditibacteriota bacterium]
MARVKEKYNRSEVVAAWGFLAPNLIGFLSFTLIPVVVSLFMAFTDWNIFGKPVWIGWENFRLLLGFHQEGARKVANDPFFWQYLYNTVYLLVGIPLGIAASLLCALVMNQKLVGITFFRTVYFLPSVSGGVALLILWKYMYNNETGIINMFLRNSGMKIYDAAHPWTGILFNVFIMILMWVFIMACFLAVLSFIKWVMGKLNIEFEGLSYNIVCFVLGFAVVAFIVAKFGMLSHEIQGFFMVPPDWLGTSEWSKPSLIIMGLWGGLGGTSMILYLAALQGVSVNLYEAAELDGASGWHKFWSITWPLISPTTFFIFIMGIIGGLQSGFMTAKIMTGGGPAGSTTTVEYYLYNTAFENFNMGYASAIAWFLFVIILILTLITWKVGGRVVNYE